MHDLQAHIRSQAGQRKRKKNGGIRTLRSLERREEMLGGSSSPDKNRECVGTEGSEAVEDWSFRNGEDVDLDLWRR